MPVFESIEPMRSGPFASYLLGEVCTWHGASAAAAWDGGALCFRCPWCHARLKPVSAEEWEHRVHAAERKNPGVADMMRWSEGMCFADSETLENAYRQAMEGQS